MSFGNYLLTYLEEDFMDHCQRLEFSCSLSWLLISVNDFKNIDILCGKDHWLGRIVQSTFLIDINKQIHFFFLPRLIKSALILEYSLGYLFVSVHSFGFNRFDWIYFLEFKNFKNY